MADMIIRQMPPFKRAYKKLRAREKLIVKMLFVRLLKILKPDKKKKEI
jgi:hypothetical protein